MTATDEHACGCADYNMSRRSLLKGMAASAAALPAVGLLDASIAYASPTDTTWTGDTLVVLSLRGGFDGLSAVVPLKTKATDPVTNYDDYAAARPNIAVPQDQLLSLDGNFGLHPALAPLKTLYNSGNFNVVVAAGMLDPNRSHFEAMEEMEKANLGASIRTGWLNRVMGRHDGALKPLSAVQVGSNNMPVSLYGDEPPVGMNSVGGFKLNGIDNTFTSAKWRAGLTALTADAALPIKNSTESTLGALDDLALVATKPFGTGYPNGGLGNALKDVARLINYGPGVKIVTLDVGDWDMHVNLGRFSDGPNQWMYRKLTEVGAALSAFAADLAAGGKLNSTTLVTMSEFGRRVGENDSAGVDHGWGNQMFVLGGNVKTDAVKGRWPGIDKVALQKANGDVAATTDYRAVLAEILVKRCNAAPEDISGVFRDYPIAMDTGNREVYPGVIA